MVVELFLQGYTMKIFKMWSVIALISGRDENSRKTLWGRYHPGTVISPIQIPHLSGISKASGCIKISLGRPGAEDEVDPAAWSKAAADSKTVPVGALCRSDMESPGQLG